MDWSDDITYAVHDLIDFDRAGEFLSIDWRTTMIQPSATAFSPKYSPVVRTWRPGALET